MRPRRGDANELRTTSGARTCLNPFEKTVGSLSRGLLIAGSNLCQWKSLSARFWVRSGDRGGGRRRRASSKSGRSARSDGSGTRDVMEVGVAVPSGAVLPSSTALIQARLDDTRVEYE